MKKFLIGFLVIAILGVGIFVGLLLVNQQQIFKQKAATPTGQTTVSIAPGAATIQRNSPYTVSINFNPAGIPISAVTVRLTYSNLGVTASGIQISQALLSSTDWSCPVKSVSSQGSTGQIDISCTNSSDSGFSASTDTLLATFSLTASQVPVINPLIVSFDSQTSTMTKKSDGQDILLTPSSTGSYTIIDTIAQSPTPTPLLVVASATPTPAGTISPTPTATASGSASPTPILFATPTASSSATMPPVPVTGFDTPTIIGAGVGSILLLIAGAALIL